MGLSAGFIGLFGKYVVSIVAVLGSVRFGTGVYFWRVTEKLERPSYMVIEKLSDGIELRQYEPYLIAETTVDASGFKEPTRNGFQACAGYIFGKNIARTSDKDSEKMAMTAPVRISGDANNSNDGSTSSTNRGEKMEMTAPVRVFGGTGAGTKAKKTKVSFVIGSKYTLKTAPKPISKSVKLRQVPGHVLAVRKFSGPPPNDARVQKEKERIMNALKNANMKPSQDETLLYGYHDPFITPNFLRRNEVALVVKGRI